MVSRYRSKKTARLLLDDVEVTLVRGLASMLTWSRT
jgi:hypothetical protein